MKRSPLYLMVLLGVLGAVTVAVASLNLLLGARAQGSPEAVTLASAWQGKTRGVTYAPPMTRSRPFKSLRLAERSLDVNGVVLGASSVMSITEAMFPKPLSVYNFGLVSNSTAAVIGEAEHISAHYAQHIRFMMVALDWSIGFIYLQAPPAPQDLSPPAQLVLSVTQKAPFIKQLHDALTYPRVQTLGMAIKSVARAPDRPKAFQQTFFEMASDEYLCADGVSGRDFDVVNRGACVGYRYDGSWTFADQKPLRPAAAMILAKAAASHSSKFSEYLLKTKGEPNALYLDRLAALARQVASAGGRVLFILPPLIPAMEQAILDAPKTGDYLRHTKRVLDAWARQDGFTVIDAGRSEFYGCQSGEFFDEHHAFPSCFGKALARFWRDDAAGAVRPGLYVVRDSE